MYSESFANLSLLEGLKDSLLGIGVVFLMLALLIVVVALMGKLNLGKKQETKPAADKPEEKPVYPDTVDLINVDEKTAAMIMAIVADETDIPLSELRFISIREL